MAAGVDLCLTFGIVVYPSEKGIPSKVIKIVSKMKKLNLSINSPSD